MIIPFTLTGDKEKVIPIDNFLFLTKIQNNMTIYGRSEIRVANRLKVKSGKVERETFLRSEEQ